MMIAGRLVKTRFLSALEGLRHGTLVLTTPEGQVHRFGSGPEIDLVLRDWALLPLLLTRGEIGLGEGYVAGLWDTGSIEALTALALRNLDHLQGWATPSLWSKIKLHLLGRMMRPNSLRGAGRNIRAHYDVGNEFYQLWLDRGMTYSSALFAPGETDLGRAQDAKYDRILGRLGQGERVLEIGCGWGGFAERAAETGRDVTAITLSPSQKGYADARLDGRAEVRLQDYRTVQGRFDAIVSIEMIEAVGEAYWPVYFAKLKECLAEGGRAVVQAITVPDAEFSLYRKTTDYIRHHTFPGGMLPCNAAMAHHARRAGLEMVGSFAFGQDYARTCRIWGENLQDMAPRLVRMGFDDRFRRNWLYYLGSCAGAFSTGRADVVQVEFAHTRA